MALVEQQQPPQTPPPPRNTRAAANKFVARERKVEAVELAHANSAAMASLHSIEATVRTNKFGQVHDLLASLLREERALYVVLPETVGSSKLLAAPAPRSRKVVVKPPAPSPDAEAAGSVVAVVAASPTATSDVTAAPAAATSCCPFDFALGPPRSRPASAIEAGGIARAAPPLPLRNVPHHSGAAVSARYCKFAPPEVKQKVVVAERLRLRIERMLVKPGGPHPPRATFEPAPKPATKVAKKFVPKCATCVPAHWPEPQPAQVVSVAPLMRFASSPPKAGSQPAHRSASAAAAGQEEEPARAADAATAEPAAATIEVAVVASSE